MDTKNTMKIFESNEFGKVRTVVKNGEPMFCLADVCRVLELSNTTMVKERLATPSLSTIEVGVQTGTKADGTPAVQNKQMLFVNEQGLYKVIFQSRKPEAEKFADWVMGEVLPSIHTAQNNGKKGNSTVEIATKENVCIFENEAFGQIRTVVTNGEIWFVASDLCRALDLSNTTVALERVTKEERSKFNLGRQGETNVVNESGLYALIFTSRKPEAQEFRRWVTNDVLPSIRKHGMYAKEELLNNVDLLLDVVTKLKEEQDARKVLEAKNAEQAQQLEEARPKVLFANAVSTSDTCILIGELAKLLKGNGIEIGQNRLFDWLREKGYLIKRRGTDYNAPTQKAMELGLFKVNESTVTNSNGKIIITKTTKVTGKGQQYFINAFLSEAENIVS